MINRSSDNSRRRFIKLTAIGLVAAPFANALLNNVAAAADPISETDPLAAAMKYKADAAQAADRKDATATCANCALYTGKAGDATGPCSIFQGKLVAAKGWCTAWAKKAA
ncbi:MAG: high-potential iron-sulfur protein [Candidatus Contendobacter sp.]|nr:high-potential iron-sulfur protein [Candidatus Contendobacter sp.]MDG4557742.1 high-potential iron-sulfur protein [Candidatus Contendobacter sp.]